MTLKQFYKLPDTKASEALQTHENIKKYKLRRILFFALGFLGFTAFFSIGYENINYFLYFPIFIILGTSISIALRYNTYITTYSRLTTLMMKDYVQNSLKEVELLAFTYNNIEYNYFKRKPSLDDITSENAQQILLSSLAPASNIMKFKTIVFRKQIPEKYVIFQKRASNYFVVENMIYSKSANCIFII